MIQLNLMKDMFGKEIWDLGPSGAEDTSMTFLLCYMLGAFLWS